MSTTHPDQIREQVRDRYAAAAKSAAEGSASCGCGSETSGASSCCGSEVALTDASVDQVFGNALYAGEEIGAAAPAIEASLGCGVPTAVADLHEGETVLDLGSGAGGDVLISARRVGASGKAIGIDMTLEMLELARANAAQA